MRNEQHNADIPRRMSADIDLYTYNYVQPIDLKRTNAPVTIRGTRSTVTNAYSDLPAACASRSRRRARRPPIRPMRS